jgi:O-antigen/teichoic acid export membrane protein
VLARVHLERIGWVTGSYMAVQFIRLVTNVGLARLLAPELFGIMLIVNTLRTGIELISDLGIGQNIVSNKRSEEPDFFNTAWTLQVIRGVLLALTCLIASSWLAEWFEKPVLAEILPVASLFFILAGFESTCRFLLQKRIALETLGKFDVATALISLVAHLVLAWATPTIWALIVGGLISSVVVTLGTHLLLPGVRNKLRWNGGYVREIVHFGKWVFLSSILYFLALNLDRLYLAKFVPLAVLGVYGIARSFSDMLTQFVTKVGNLIVFPLVAASGKEGEQLRAKLAGPRFKLIACAAIGVASFAAVSDLLITTLYDQRYHAAAEMLPLLTIGIWFAILATMGESVLLGLGKPIYGAVANGAKLVALSGGLILLLPRFGVIGAVYAIGAAEIIRYVAVMVGLTFEKLQFIRQDLASTAGAAALAALLMQFT